MLTKTLLSGYLRLETMEMYTKHFKLKQIVDVSKTNYSS